MRTCALALVLALAAGSAAAVDRTPGVVSNLTGTLRIQQTIPCADDVDLTTPVDGGRLEFTPAQGVAVTGGRQFAMTRANVSFAPFSITRSCTGIDSTTRSFDDVNVQLGSLLSFTAAATGPDTYAISIAPAAVNFYETAKIDGDPESQYLRPSENVTGSVNLATGAVQLHVVIHITEHFRAGCAFGHCIIDDDYPGTLTADLGGTIGSPDADGDGVPDREDNCRFVANPDQSPVPTPAITAPDAVILASCADHDIGAAAANDVCDHGPVSVTNNAPAVFNSGANVVTWSATDTNGRVATAGQAVTVVDTTKPAFTFVPPDKQVFDCGPVDLGQATATDDCAGTPTITNDAPGYFYVGDTVVTWKATDTAGNSATAVQKVSVTDLAPPAVACTATTPLGSSFIVTGSDACGAVTLTLGSYVIANGELIKIEEVGQPGIRLQNVVAKDGIRKFFVGKGEAIIVATDAAGNAATASCH